MSDDTSKPATTAGAEPASATGGEVLWEELDTRRLTTTEWQTCDCSVWHSSKWATERRSSIPTAEELMLARLLRETQAELAAMTAKWQETSDSFEMTQRVFHQTAAELAAVTAERDRMISAHGLTMEERDAAVEARDKAVALNALEMRAFEKAVGALSAQQRSIFLSHYRQALEGKP